MLYLSSVLFPSEVIKQTLAIGVLQLMDQKD